MEGVASAEELEKKTMYIPRELEGQSEEFRQKLGFFQDEFLFTPTQMNVFLKSLGENLSQTESPAQSQAAQPPTVNGQGGDQQEEDIVEVMMNEQVK